MEQSRTKRREPAPPAQIHQLLASHYSKLLQWGAVLTRRDPGKAEEIVQELCLYFSLTKPDLSDVADLDGYLYTCLRNIYLSGLARSSREAMHFVSIAEFDSFDTALASKRSGDPLQKQNDLRRICSYTVWRKESSKSASYFILHFFHGYGRREIAELARLPISAIYNKLKTARDEVKAYLEDRGKLRIVKRDRPPEPTLSWSVLSPGEIFNELRSTILSSRISDCLPEEELLAYYHSLSNPIPCSLLAHIVSCERCLAIVDRNFRRPTLKDREPLDGFGQSADGDGSAPGSNGASYKAMLRSVNRRWGRVHDHRPRTLSIAVNGQIVAFHDVQACQSKLSARIEHPGKARFVEVFSEQDVRLALLAIDEAPPRGSDERTLRVELSDDRWLELKLSFDGLGLNSEVAYFDPALAIEAVEEDAEEAPLVFDLEDAPTAHSRGILSRGTSALAAFVKALRGMAMPSAIGWAIALAVVFSLAGYIAYRHANPPIDARAILSESARIETANLEGQTEHQVLGIEELSADGQVLQQGEVDLWKDGDGSRYLRRLYDPQHRMLAAEWRNKTGEHSSHQKNAVKDRSGKPSSLLMDGLWDQDLSFHAFSALGGEAPQVRAVEDGYELTITGPTEGHPRLISATLVLDRHLMPIEATMRVRSESGIRELRFVQQEFERKPSVSVPDTIFDPQDGSSHFEDQNGVHRNNPHHESGTDPQLAELQIAVLYQLNGLGADTGEPVEVNRTGDGRLRVSGTITNDTLKQKILSRLLALANHRLLDLRLLSPRDLRAAAGSRVAPPRDTNVYEINEGRRAADAALRKYFGEKGLTGEHLDSAVGQFSQEALEHAQAALQHAYALDRLGNALSASELASINYSSRRQWTEMTARHASGLERELRALRGQLAEILGEETPATSEEAFLIENPAQFNDAADQLLQEMQNLNRDVGIAFTSNASAETQAAHDTLLKATLNAIPLRRAEEVQRFALALDASAKAASANQSNDPDVSHSSKNPQ